MKNLVCHTNVMHPLRIRLAGLNVDVKRYSKDSVRFMTRIVTHVITNILKRASRPTLNNDLISKLFDEENKIEYLMKNNLSRLRCNLSARMIKHLKSDLSAYMNLELDDEAIIHLYGAIDCFLDELLDISAPALLERGKKTLKIEDIINGIETDEDWREICRDLIYRV